MSIEHSPARGGLMSSSAVRKHCGGIADITLWRWQKFHGFPPPHVVIGTRNYWRTGDVLAWIERCHRKTVAEREGQPP